MSYHHPDYYKFAPRPVDIAMVVEIAVIVRASRPQLLPPKSVEKAGSAHA